MFFNLLLHPSTVLWSQGCSQTHPPCSAPVGTVPPLERRVEGVQKEMGDNGHSISQLPAVLKLLAQKQGGNHLHPLPQPWLVAVGAPASAIIWRKDPVHIPGGIRTDLMETCEATRPHFLMGQHSQIRILLSFYVSACLARH